MSVTPELSTEPVRLSLPVDHTGEDRVVIFTMERMVENPDAPDGDLILQTDEFSIPKRHRPNIGLRFLWEAKTHGESMAAANLLESALGLDGFMALMAHDDLTVEQNERIQRIVLSYTMGDVEAGKGQRPSGSRS